MAKDLEIRAVFKAVDKMTKPLNRMSRRVQRVTNRMKRGLKSVNKYADKLVHGFGRVAAAAGKLAVGGVVVLGAGIGYLVKQFSKIENAKAAFTPLLGGADKANKLVDRLNQTAASTPFQFETLAGSAQQLLPVMNGDIDRTIKTIRMMGDTAGGNAQKLESITRGFTKASLKGKVDMESLNMIAEAGVPIFTELAKSMGKEPGKKFFKDISAGKVKVQDLTKAFEQMASEGGIFFKGMEIASKTTSGIFSTMKDNIELTAAGIGEALAPVIKDLMLSVIDVASNVRNWIENNKELIKSRVAEFAEKLKKGIIAVVDGIKKLVTKKNAVDGFFKAIEKVSNAIKWLSENAKTIGIIIGIIGGLIIVLKILIGVVAAVNAVVAIMNVILAANPIVLIVLAIVALIAILVALGIKFGIFKKIAAIMREVPGVIKAAWEGLKTFFADLWNGIVDRVRNGVKKVVGFIQPVGDFLASIFGGGEDQKVTVGAAAGGGGGGGPQLVTPGEKTARMISETRKTTTAEVTIKDQTGRAEVTRGALGPGVSMPRTGTY